MRWFIIQTPTVAICKIEEHEYSTTTLPPTIMDVENASLQQYLSNTAICFVLESCQSSESKRVGKN